ncbi:MAG: hypothetical protein SF187_02855 [Deltaproteobacteria bacterium]|nr:hypothetical protein [Deltaproteobacteria bacterium]
MATTIALRPQRRDVFEWARCRREVMRADSAAKYARWVTFSYSAPVRAYTQAFVTFAALAWLGLSSAAAAATGPADGGLLRGPHPFLKPNALQLAGGFHAASGGGIGGLKLKAAFEYELVGSLWLNLHVGFVDGSDKPVDGRACATCGQMADTMGGLSYRLRMDVPVILTGTLAGGFLFVFPDQYSAAMGLGVRGSISGRYYLYDWLGFGLEIGTTVGFASHEKASGLSRGLASLDALVGVEVQFDTP